jgi:hypothetical protein
MWGTSEEKRESQKTSSTCHKVDKPYQGLLGGGEGGAHFF